MGVEYRHYLIPEENDFRPDPDRAARLIAALVEARFATRTEADPFPAPSSHSRERDVDAYLEDPRCFLETADRESRPWPCPCEAADLARLGEGDFLLAWDIERFGTSGLAYPLANVPDDAYYSLELHFADDFVYETSEQTDPFRDASCCGEPLDYWWPSAAEGAPAMFDHRIRRACPKCGRMFRPQDHVAVRRHPRTGERFERPGGATYRFAVVVDCGKCLPEPVGRFMMNPSDLVATRYDLMDKVPADWERMMNRDLVAIVERVLDRPFYEIGTLY